ncbi:MAG TPA: choice-of-anchor Q domain-containing protein [Gaiellaceae bacterium]
MKARLPRWRAHRFVLSAGAVGLLLLPATLACATAQGGASKQVSAAAAPAPKGANLWIDPNGGSCTRSGTPHAYVDGQACASMQAAWRAAQSGDTIAIQNGTYPSQGIEAGNKKLTFKAAGPGRPRFGQLVSAAQNLTFRGLQFDDQPTPLSGPCPTAPFGVLVACGANQTFDNVVVDGMNTGLRHGIETPGPKFVFENGEVRNVVNQKGFEGGSDDMVIQNNLFHDIKVTNDEVHNECAYVENGNRQVWRGNRFVGCPTMALAFTNYENGPPYRDVLVEDNLFGHTLDSSQQWHPGSCALVLGWGFNQQNTYIGWTFRYNTFEGCVLNQGSPAPGDDGAGRWYGNLGGIGDCPKEFVYSYNVGQTCGGVGDVPVRPAVNDADHPNQAPFYVNAPGGDFQLKAGDPAVNRGDPTKYPNVDGTDKSRLVGSAPDAGAFEYRGPGATTGILVVGGVDGTSAPRQVATAAERFEQQNPANALVTVEGAGDAPRGALKASFRTAFDWLDKAKVGLLQTAGPNYVRRIGSVEVVVVDSSSVTPAQTRWLRRTLARKTKLFRVVALDDPPYACDGSYTGDAQVRAQWAPLFQRYGVRLVISGHAPNYQRFQSGRVTYIVHGAGAGPVSAPRACPAGYPQRGAASASHGFVYFTVDAGGVLVRSVGLSGKVIDLFRLP